MAVVNGYRHYAGVKGSKIHYVGADESVYQYTDIQSAIDAAQNNDVIMIEPGTYTLTTKLTVNKPLTFVGLRPAGDKGVIITSANTLTTELVKVDLAAQAASAEVVFENIYFLAAATDLGAVIVDNASMGNYKLKCRFINCVLEVASATTTAYALEVNHTGVAASNEIQVKVTGQGWHKVHGIDFEVADDQDALEVVGMVLEPKGTLSGVNTSAGNKTFLLTLKECIVTHEKGASGGHAGQTLVALNTYSKTGFTYAIADTNDFTGSHTEGALLPAS